MDDASETLITAAVTPIYDAMLERAIELLESGSLLEAADLLTTAAETMHRFDHPQAIRVAGWAWSLLEDAAASRGHPGWR